MAAGTYSQIHIQVVFAVKHRQALLDKSWRQEVFKYMSGIVSQHGCKSIIINGVEDHVHCFIGLKPAISVADLVRDIKNNSSNYINNHQFLKSRFSWQEGYGVFSYSRSQVSKVYHYILHQEEHHKKSSFKKEYIGFLRKFEIEYKEEYLFNWITAE